MFLKITAPGKGSLIRFTFPYLTYNYETWKGEADWPPMQFTDTEILESHITSLAEAWASLKGMNSVLISLRQPPKNIKNGAADLAPDRQFSVFMFQKLSRRGFYQHDFSWVSCVYEESFPDVFRISNWKVSMKMETSLFQVLVCFRDKSN